MSKFFRCPRCGSSEISIEYDEGKELKGMKNFKTDSYKRILLSCDKCGEKDDYIFGWSEKCVVSDNTENGGNVNEMCKL